MSMSPQLKLKKSSCPSTIGTADHFHRQHVLRAEFDELINARGATDPTLEAEGSVDGQLAKDRSAARELPISLVRSSTRGMYSSFHRAARSCGRLVAVTQCLPAGGSQGVGLSTSVARLRISTAMTSG